MQTADEMRAFADRVQAAADTITELNERADRAPECWWRSRDLADYARHLRQEADEL